MNDKIKAKWILYKRRDQMIGHTLKDTGIAKRYFKGQRAASPG